MRGRAKLALHTLLMRGVRSRTPTHLLEGVKEGPEGVFLGGGAVQQVSPDGFLCDFLDLPRGFLHPRLRLLDLATPAPRPSGSCHVRSLGHTFKRSSGYFFRLNRSDTL